MNIGRGSGVQGIVVEMSRAAASSLFADQALDEIADLRRLSARLARDRADAEDLVQDTYLRALRAQHRYAPGTDLKAWLTTILRNLASNRRRDLFRARVRCDESRLAAARETVSAASPTAEAVLVGQCLDPRLRCALEALPKALRDAVWLRDVEGMPYAAMASRLRIPIGTVMSRISRGRRLLYERMTVADPGTSSPARIG